MDWAERIRVARQGIRQAEWEFKLAVVDARKRGITMKRILDETGVAESTTVRYEKEIAAIEQAPGKGQFG